MVLTIGAVCGKDWFFSDFNFHRWWVQVHTKQNLWGRSVKITFVIWNGKGTEREVYILPILVEAKLVVKAMFLRRRMPETCRGRLII